MSRTSSIPPYFHPTTVCFVDDNYGFSQSLLLTVPENLLIESYLSPEEALDALSRGHPRQPLADLCFSKQGSVIQLDLNVLEQEIKHIDRFKRISVLLVDYAMPTMNGLDLCAALQDKDIRRVLLTGVADEKTAVKAFNDGLIDHYLPKAALSSAGGIVPCIRQQQALFFQNYQHKLSQALGIAAPPFTLDQAFQTFFQSFLDTHQVVEYYMITDPIGYLCLTSAGTTLQLLIQDSVKKRENMQVLEDFQAPLELREAVASDRLMVNFYEHPRDYLGMEQFPWDDVTFSVTNISGTQEWQCSIVLNAPMDIDFDPLNACYDRFLESTNYS